MIEPRFAREHPRAYLGLYGVAGLVIAALGAWAFFAMADEVSEKGAMVRIDVAVTAWLQAHGTEAGESIFSAVSLLGGWVLTGILVVVAIALLVRRDWWNAALLAVTCGGGSLLNVLLKQIIHRARPSFASEFGATTWSFPSGHAMDSLMAYGVLAYLCVRAFPSHRRLIVALAIALVTTIGYARIYLGVHYLSDVLAGYAAGMVWLAVCVTGYRFARRTGLEPA